MPDTIAAIVYAEQLRYLQWGEPLWQPEPPDDGEVAIGDVGFIDDGRFVRLFNAVHGSADEPEAVPHGFEKLQYNAKRLELKNDKYMVVEPHHSKSVTRNAVNAELSRCAQNVAALGPYSIAIEKWYSRVCDGRSTTKSVIYVRIIGMALV